MSGAEVTSKLDSSSSMMMCGRLAVVSQVAAGTCIEGKAACADDKCSGLSAGGSASIQPVEASREIATTPERARLEI